MTFTSYCDVCGRRAPLSMLVVFGTIVICSICERERHSSEDTHESLSLRP